MLASVVVRETSLCAYLSLSLMSSATLLCFLGEFAGWCCPKSPICASTFPLLLACLNTSLALAFGYCGGFSAASCPLLPLACFPPLPPPPEMVVLLRRLAGPLISALSLISAASITQVWPARHCWSNCSPRPSLQVKTNGLPPSQVVSVPGTIRRFITTAAQGAIDSGVARFVFSIDILQSSWSPSLLPD